MQGQFNIDITESGNTGHFNKSFFNRRSFLATTATLLAGTAIAGPVSLLRRSAAIGSRQQRYYIAVSDLMIYKRQRIGAFALTHEIGADGVEVDIGGLGDRPTFDSKLNDSDTRRAFLAEAKKYKLAIPSIAMTGFYAQSFATRPTWQQMFTDCLDTQKQMGVRVGFLPFGIQVDLRKEPGLRAAVIQRLKIVGSMAAKAGLVIGIESGLDAKGEKALLMDINSKGIKSYFNFETALDGKRDLHTELQILGKEAICQIHCTNADGYHLQQDPAIDMPAVKKTLDKMGWSGWLVLQRSRDQKDPKNVLYNFGDNTRYMQSVFQDKKVHS